MSFLTSPVSLTLIIFFEAAAALFLLALIGNPNPCYVHQTENYFPIINSQANNGMPGNEE